MVWVVLACLLIGFIAGFLLYASSVYSINKDKKEKYGDYPCEDYLNNALRFLAYDEKANKGAISEICYCLFHADGKVYPNVKEVLIEKNLYPLRNVKKKCGYNDEQI